ncbi:MAG: hypothetical protein HY810_04680 [Candidatus Omnitrophica bacterium]|nr:hypothetical protein [Candidatus Omnitrophota bacterium]
MNVLLFILALMISFIIVRIGAIAFQLTGLDWSLASFQALSCFSGTGFTTKEAELITGHPQRRKIASALIILGNIVLVLLIATLANSLRVEMLVKNTVPLIHWAYPASAAPWINLAVIILTILITYRIMISTKLDVKLTNFLRARLVKNEIIKPVSFEELVVATGGYGISKVEVCNSSPILDTLLMDSKLRAQDITVLAIERGGEIIPNPSAHTKISLKDSLICFGKLENIRKTIYVVPE